ncbi:MAG: M14 family zinc carboxypeptidase [Oribacterium sp.]|nr:M14 family zinc carboxypeptidase [Oribacterium sp.]
MKEVFGKAEYMTRFRTRTFFTALFTASFMAASSIISPAETLGISSIQALNGVINGPAASVSGGSTAIDAALKQIQDAVSNASSVVSGIQQGFTVPLPEGYDFNNVGTYTYDKMTGDLSHLKASYPSMQMDVLGTTVDGRQIYHVVVGNPNAPHKILVHAAIHGREYITAQLVMREMASLLEMQAKSQNYAGKSMADVLNAVCIHFVPMVNPDGVSISQLGMAGIRSQSIRDSIQSMAAQDAVSDMDTYLKYWKNNARGVNLNKNFDANWSVCSDTKGHPSADEYKGPSAESEVESRALADLTRRVHFDRTISYHTQGEVVYWYFGFGSYVNNARIMAQIVNNNSGYGISDNYAPNSAGGFKDWAEQKLGIPSVTIECGKGTSPVEEGQITDMWTQNQGVLPDLLITM